MARYALIVGIADYRNPLASLSKTVTDAAAVAALLRQHGHFQDVTLLTGNVSAKQLGKALAKLLHQQAVKNEALIYFTGHGLAVTDSLGQSQGFLATSDCHITVENGQIVEQRRGIALASLNQLIQQSDLSNLVVLLDCCHGGLFLERNLVAQSLTAFRSRQDYYLIAACRGFEQAWAKRNEPHSIFTGALLAGLSQDNARDDGQVTGDDLFAFIARQLRGSGQEPIRTGHGRSIVIVSYPPHPQTLQQPVDEICPYQGLRYFTESQAKFFFGRKLVVETLKQALEPGAFVLLIGASGSGKSSLLRAGLMPWLRAEGSWRILGPVLPSIDPLTQLKQVFKPCFESDLDDLVQLYDAIDNNSQRLSAVIPQLPGDEKFLLLVDQFEELFTLCPAGKEAERDRFIQLLTQVVENDSARLTVVVAVRADFLDSCLQYDALTQQIQQHAVYIPPLTEQDLTDIIVKPAAMQGHRLENGLLALMLADIRQEPDCLPLLEFTLTELWPLATQQDYQLTLPQYQQLGRISGALNRRAEEIYDTIGQKFGQPGQDWVQRICLSLVRTGTGMKDTRQRQPKSDLLAMAGDEQKNQQAMVQILERLIQGRLLVTGGDEAAESTTTQESAWEEAWVDLSHEALIESWQRLAKWREADRDVRRLVDRVKDAQRDWLNHEKSDRFLLMGGLLDQLQENWPKLEPYLQSAKQFYQQSDIYSSQQKIQRQELQQELEERRHAQDQLLYLALHDAWTGLPNRVLFMQRVEETMEKQARGDENYLFAVMFLDIDRFRAINDRFGYFVGDLLLIEVAQRLVDCLHHTNTLTRLSGDESSLLIDDILNPEAAIAIAQHIQQVIQSSPFQLDEQEIWITASIGITLGSAEYQRPYELLRDAEIAMYRAKEREEGCYEVFQPAGNLDDKSAESEL